MKTTFGQVRVNAFFIHDDQEWEKISTTTAKLLTERGITVFAPTQEVVEQEVYVGFTRTQLHAAFDKVKNKKNWKYPIDATINVNEEEVTQAAICFFAGGQVCFGEPKANGRVKVMAPGYYAIVGA